MLTTATTVITDSRTRFFDTLDSRIGVSHQNLCGDRKSAPVKHDRAVELQSFKVDSLRGKLQAAEALFFGQTQSISPSFSLDPIFGRQMTLNWGNCYHKRAYFHNAREDYWLERLQP